MNIALCYESVLPHRGGCETYIADLARRLCADGHEVHLYASHWDALRLPEAVHYHLLPSTGGLRFLKPWRFSATCLEALKENGHDVSIGFDKTWGQDILYPMGGLRAACADHNINKYERRGMRFFARLGKYLDVAHWSYSLLERRQYLGKHHPQVVVNSDMVRRHFQEYYQISRESIHVVHSAVDPERLQQQDRPKLRQEGREEWGLQPNDVAGLFIGKNYRLKGLEPLLRAVRNLCRRPEYLKTPPPFRLIVAGNNRTIFYKRMAARLGIEDHVRFLGQYKDIRKAFFAADFLVHPTFYDPCSLVVLEALACDLPIITTRANGASELMHMSQEGFVVDDPHDHEHVGWCIAQLLDPATRKPCVQAARLAASRWTFEHHYRALVNVFEEVAKRKRAA